MKRMIIEELKDGRGWHAWIETASGKFVIRLTDVCIGASRAEAAGKIILGYPEVSSLPVGTVYAEG